MKVSDRELILSLWFALWVIAATSQAADTSVEIEASVDAFADGEPSEQSWLRIAPRVTRRLSPRVLLTVAPVLEVDSHGDIDGGGLYDDGDRGIGRAPLRFDRLSRGSI